MQKGGVTLRWGERIGGEGGWSARLQGAFLASRFNQVTHVLAKRGLFGKPEVFSLEGMQVTQDGRLLLTGRAPAAPGRGSVRLTGKTPVSVAGGRGSLQGVVLDLRSRSARRILVGYLGEVRGISHELVQNLASGSPSVRVSAQAAALLPVYRPDHEALRNAVVALEKATPVGDTYAAVELQVWEGVAYLMGNVLFPVQREEAERAVSRAKGVLEVQNGIVTDWELRLGVAAALAREGISRHGQVTVRSVRGKVTLLGRLPSQEMAERAFAVAQGFPGVRRLSSELSVEEAAGERPLLTPEVP
ncbi:MAG: BON domain-containing protein [Chloroflexi bacterium]|nr:BON domain-containing protein [Chloroflexota bacterium]